MKTVSIKEIKQDLKFRTQDELLELCLRLAKFKKENKELLSYLLFESSDEKQYIENVKNEIDSQFELVNTKSYYFIRKSIRKILSNIKKFARYSKNKETEVELLIYFCSKLNDFSPSIKRSTQLKNVYYTQIETVKKKLLALHEDLQYDYGVELQKLT